MEGKRIRSGVTGRLYVYESKEDFSESVGCGLGVIWNPSLFVSVTSI